MEDLGDLRKVCELSFCLRRRRLTFGAHRGLAAGAARGVCVCVRETGGRWKSQHRKIVFISPYVEKPLNSKVIKSFVPELRSRKCFLCLRILMLSIYVRFGHYHIYPTPPLGQDMTQGQFLSGV